MQAALDGGAAGFISKSSPSEVILGALRLILAGGVYAPPELLTGQSAAVSKSQLDALTPRQREVLALIGQGKSNKEIGKALDLSDATVKQHVSAILRTLGVANRMQAMLSARRMPTAN